MSGEPWVMAEVLPVNLDTWQVNQQLLAYGRCPRCGEGSNQQLQFDGVLVIDAPKLFRCNCSAAHAGRPARLNNGCGAWWVGRVHSSDGMTFSVAAEPGPTLHSAAAAVATENESDAVAVATERWVPGVAAMLGLSGLASAVVARDAVSALPWVWALVAYLLVCVTVVAAGGATYLAYRASATHLRRAVFLACLSTFTLLVALGVLWLYPSSSAVAAANIG